MQAVPLHLLPGSDLRHGLEEFALARAAAGFVIGVVGDLSRAAFQCPGQPEPTVIEGDLEIITLNGTFSPQGVHLHLSLSDGACQVWGGHLEHGSQVRKGADLLVGLVAAPPFTMADAAPIKAHPAPAGPLADGGTPAVEIAVLEGCPFSARALRMLRTLGIPHRVERVRSPEQRASIAERSGRPSLPQVFIEGRAIGGYDALADLHGQGALEGLRAR